MEFAAPSQSLCRTAEKNQRFPLNCVQVLARSCELPRKKRLHRQKQKHKCQQRFDIRRLAIYTDGAAFHTGQNLRRDRFIRDKLRTGSPPWTVVELRVQDLAKGGLLIQELM